MRCPCGRSKPAKAELCIHCRTAARAFAPAPDQNTCTVCDFKAKSRAGLVAHVRAAHGDEADAE